MWCHTLRWGIITILNTTSALEVLGSSTGLSHTFLSFFPIQYLVTISLNLINSHLPKPRSARVCVPFAVVQQGVRCVYACSEGNK